MIQEIKEKEAVIAGDGRHDSMGHTAKYFAYMLFNCTSPNITHFSLVQVWHYFYDTNFTLSVPDYFIFSSESFAKESQVISFF